MTAPETGAWGAYWRGGLWRIDAALIRSWGLGRAYSTSFRERPRWAARGAALTYGETRWPAMYRILGALALTAEDSFLDLGSGTGRFSLFVARIHGIPTLGIELVPSFVVRANRIAAGLGLTECRFQEADFFEVPWSGVTVIYCSTTTFDEPTLRRFENKCGELSAGSRVVSVTQPPRVKGFRLEWMEVLDFSWGPGTVFVHRRVP